MANDLLRQLTAKLPKTLPIRDSNWFATRLLAWVSNKPVRDPQGEALHLVERANSLVKGSVSDVSVTGLEEMTDLIVMFGPGLPLRIAYRLLGVHLDVFLGTDSPDLFLFTLKRRCEAVAHMVIDINNPLMFQYPTFAQHQWRPNKTASAYWDPLTLDNAGNRVDADTGAVAYHDYPYYPSTLGRQSPALAIDSLFVEHDEVERKVINGKTYEVRTGTTFCDCSCAAMIVLFTSLVHAAKDPQALTVALTNEPDPYLALDSVVGPSWAENGEYRLDLAPVLQEPKGPDDHVTAHFSCGLLPKESAFAMILYDGDTTQQIQVESVERDTEGFTGYVQIEHLDSSFRAGARMVLPNYPQHHLTTDRRSQFALFEVAFIRPDDLQIGDHIYLQSHPFARTRYQTPWGGEHAIITDVGTRIEDMWLSGFGLRNCRLRDAILFLLTDANNLLEIARKVVDRFLESTGGEPTALINDPEKMEQMHAKLRSIFQQPAGADVEGTCTVHEFDAIMYDAEWCPGAGRQGYLPVESVPRVYPDESVPWNIVTFDGKVGDVDVTPDDLLMFGPAAEATRLFPIQRNMAINPVTNERERYGFFYDDDNLGTYHIFFPLWNGGGKEGRTHLSYGDLKNVTFWGNTEGLVRVTRPRVSLDAGYLAHLKDIGAL